MRLPSGSGVTPGAELLERLGWKAGDVQIEPELPRVYGQIVGGPEDGERVEIIDGEMHRGADFD